MKKIIFMFLMAALVLFCANAEGIREERAGTGGSMSDITGQEWKLIEVYIDKKDTQFTRSGQPEELKTIFTIKFDEKTVSGTGAPNQYSAPYTADDNHNIKIMIVRSTMMASLFESKNLTEHNFFTYVQNSYSWRFTGERMELLSKTADGQDVRLVFGL